MAQDKTKNKTSKIIEYGLAALLIPGAIITAQILENPAVKESIEDLKAQYIAAKTNHTKKREFKKDTKELYKKISDMQKINLAFPNPGKYSINDYKFIAGTAKTDGQKLLALEALRKTHPDSTLSFEQKIDFAWMYVQLRNPTEALEILGNYRENLENLRSYFDFIKRNDGHPISSEDSAQVLNWTERWEDVLNRVYAEAEMLAGLHYLQDGWRINASSSFSSALKHFERLKNEYHNTEEMKKLLQYLIKDLQNKESQESIKDFLSKRKNNDDTKLDAKNYNKGAAKLKLANNQSKKIQLAAARSRISNRGA
ncbi:MAG: hypothetical protein FWD33_03700 [Alphaproteobacteria bacterium]|nr:hypothetical protein [Alphaproteobacteria bacterium]